MPQRGPWRDQLQQIGEFVDRTFASLALRRETLGEFTTVTLAALLEHDEITQQDAAIAADAVGHNFTLVEELVEVGATHSETLRGLAWTEHSQRGNSGEVIAGAHAIDHALQEITHLGTDAVAANSSSASICSAGIPSVWMVFMRPILSHLDDTNALDVTDESTLGRAE